MCVLPIVCQSVTLQWIMYRDTQIWFYNNNNNSDRDTDDQKNHHNHAHYNQTIHIMANRCLSYQSKTNEYLPHWDFTGWPKCTFVRFDLGRNSSFIAMTLLLLSWLIGTRVLNNSSATPHNNAKWFRHFQQSYFLLFI